MVFCHDTTDSKRSKKNDKDNDIQSTTSSSSSSSLLDDELLPHLKPLWYRLGLVLFAICQNGMLQGLIFGWASIDDTLLAAPLEKGGTQLTVHETTVMFTWASSLGMGSPLVLGILLDKYGPRFCSCFSCCIVMIGFQIFAISTSFRGFATGICFIAFGGPGILSSMIHISNLFPGYENLGMSLLSGSTALSFSVFTIFGTLWEKYDTITYQTLFGTYVWITALYAIGSYYLYPDEPYEKWDDLLALLSDDDDDDDDEEEDGGNETERYFLPAEGEFSFTKRSESVASSSSSKEQDRLLKPQQQLHHAIGDSIQEGETTEEKKQKPSSLGQHHTHHHHHHKHHPHLHASAISHQPSLIGIEQSLDSYLRTNDTMGGRGGRSGGGGRGIGGGPIAITTTTDVDAATAATIPSSSSTLVVASASEVVRKSNKHRAVVKTDSFRQSEWAMNSGQPQLMSLKDQPFYVQLTSGTYFRALLVFISTAYWTNFYVATISTELGDQQLFPVNVQHDFTKTFTLINSTGMIASFIVGSLLDRVGLEFSTVLTLLWGLLHIVLLHMTQTTMTADSHSKSGTWQMVASFWMYMLFRNFLYPLYIGSLTERLGFKYFGVLLGIGFGIGGLVQMSMTALDEWVQGDCHLEQDGDNTSGTCDSGWWAQMHMVQFIQMGCLMLCPVLDRWEIRNRNTKLRQILGTPPPPSPSAYGSF